MKNKLQPLAITMGDPSGIGPEIILKSLTVLKNHNYLILGDPLIFQSAIERFGFKFELNKIKSLSEANFKSSIVNLLITSELTKNPNFGETSSESGKASFNAIVEAIKLAKTPNRYIAGLIEVTLKEHISDRTQWQRMLKNELVEGIDLLDKKEEMLAHLSSDLSKYACSYSEIIEITYPVNEYPKKVKSLSFDKVSEIEGVLAGIKGQYLIFDNGEVLNIRKHNGYKVSLEV